MLALSKHGVLAGLAAAEITGESLRTASQIENQDDTRAGTERRQHDHP